MFNGSDVGLVVVIEYGVVLANGVDVIKELRLASVLLGRFVVGVLYDFDFDNYQRGRRLHTRYRSWNYWDLHQIHGME